ncbi:MAG: hypothetical protein WDW36_003544 [Sanguina aurantia]
MWKVQGPVDERAALVTTVVPIHAVLVLEVDAMPASFRVPASLDDEQLSMPSPGTAASQRAGHDSLTVRLQRCMWKVQGPVDERAALVTTVVPIHAVLVLEVDAMPASFRVPASLDDEQLSMPSPGTAASQRAGHDSLTVRLQRCMWKVQGPVDERAALVTTVVPIHAVLVLEVDAMPASFRVPASLDDEQLSMPSPGTAASQVCWSTAGHVSVPFGGLPPKTSHAETVAVLVGDPIPHASEWSDRTIHSVPGVAHVILGQPRERTCTRLRWRAGHGQSAPTAACLDPSCACSLHHLTGVAVQLGASVMSTEEAMAESLRG